MLRLTPILQIISLASLWLTGMDKINMAKSQVDVDRA